MTPHNRWRGTVNGGWLRAASAAKHYAPPGRLISASGRPSTSPLGVLIVEVFHGPI